MKGVSTTKLDGTTLGHNFIYLPRYREMCKILLVKKYYCTS